MKVETTYSDLCDTTHTHTYSHTHTHHLHSNKVTKPPPPPRLSSNFGVKEFCHQPVCQIAALSFPLLPWVTETADRYENSIVYVWLKWCLFFLMKIFFQSYCCIKNQLLLLLWWK